MKRKRIILLLILFIAFLGVGITYSAFRSDAKATTGDQNLASFIFETNHSNYLDIPLTDLNPGEKENYLFSVTNTSNDKTSEVTIEYQMTIKTYHIVPLTIKLYKLGSSIEEFIFECDESFSRNLDNELVCNVPVQTMIYSKEVIDEYKLEIDFPASYNDPMYSGLVDFINLEIKSNQKTN